MKKSFYIFIIISLQSAFSFAQSEYSVMRDGNKMYDQNKYNGATEQYRKALEFDPNSKRAIYNLGDALYREGKFEEAASYFDKAATAAVDKKDKAKAYHNLGNSFVKSKKYKEALESYKRSLINNPNDEETRYNYALAKEQLRQEEQKKKEEEKKKEENKDDKKDENKDQQDKKEEQEQQEQEQQQQEEDKKEEEQQQQQQQNQMSKQDAERMLENLNNREKEVQKDLQKKKKKTIEIQIEKDW